MKEGKAMQEKSRAVIIVGNGPSLAKIDYSRFPQDAEVWRCTQFFCEKKYYVGRRVDKCFVCVPPLEIYLTLRAIVKNGDYDMNLSAIYAWVEWTFGHWKDPTNVEYKMALAAFRAVIGGDMGEYMSGLIPKDSEIADIVSYHFLNGHHAMLTGIKMLVAAYLEGYDDIYIAGIDNDYSADKIARPWNTGVFGDAEMKNTTRIHNTELQLELMSYINADTRCNLYSLSPESPITKIIPMAPIVGGNFEAEPKPDGAITKLLPNPFAPPPESPITKIIPMAPVVGGNFEAEPKPDGAITKLLPNPFVPPPVLPNAPFRGKVKFYAFRPNNGATGGPGGVLYLQKTLLGDEYRGVPLEYHFKSEECIRREGKRRRRNWASFDYDLAVYDTIKRELFSFGNYYVANDIATAYALSLLGRKYSLIYHQQGPIVEERINFGCRDSSGFKKKLARIERRAFTHAQSVHFPAKGAEAMYFNSPFATVKRNDVRVGSPLPNTIEFADGNARVMDNSCREGGLRFACVGSLQPAKGQDRVLEFMSFLLAKYGQPVHLTIAGVGVLENEVRRVADELKKKYTNFDYAMPGFVGHSEINRILSESDVYIMLHRVSIFDMATLEAMSYGLTPVLSDVGGNLDFNKDDNVIFVRGDEYASAADKLLGTNLHALGEKAKYVYEKFFSPNSFRTNMHSFLDGIIEEIKK
jgi:glycosyltransferase involved in cell wall biosynthesis